MTFKILHLSDIHIRKLRYHYEYRIVFEELYKKAKELKPDIIVNTGDTFHTKLDLSPEAIELSGDFFSKLANIAPFHMILGNHDLNLKNQSRLDSVTPIVTNINHPNIHLHKYSGIVPVRSDIDLHILSIVDPENWPTKKDVNKINIALYHGSISGVKTDQGWILEHGDLDIESLQGYDYALLGDIHKTNQKVDLDGKFRFPGSTIQQNHGETNDKGFLIWEIEDKDNFKVDHHVLLNPKPFITIELTPKGRMPKGTEIPSGARLRLISNNNLPIDVMKKAVNVAKSRFRPESIVFLNRAAGERGNVEIANNFKVENLRDIAVQEKLIREYVTDYEPTEEILQKVFELNRKLNNKIEEAEEFVRNINWNINKFKWDNLFNYGPGNEIDFANLNGIVGIFGKNFSGKSGAIDSVLYTLFNTTSKNERKNYNIINQHKEDCTGQLELQIGDVAYSIKRTSEKYVKRLKGVETNEAKTTLDFSRIEEDGSSTSLNGNTRNLTDANIRKIFGSIEDFLLTSMSSQLDSLSFIKEGSTKRKEILAKFLDLEIFESKFKLAKEESADLKAILRRVEEIDYDRDILLAEFTLEEANKELAKKTRGITNLKKKLLVTKEDLIETQKKIDLIPEERIDIKQLLLKREETEKEVTILSNKIADSKKENEILNKSIQEIEAFINQISIEDIKNKKDEYEKNKIVYDNIVNLTKNLKTEYDFKKKKLNLLNEVPCGNEYPDCKFIKDAHETKIVLPDLEACILENITEAKKQKAILELIGYEDLKEIMAKYVLFVEKKNKHKLSIKDNKINIQRFINKINSFEEIQDKNQIDILEYEKNKEIIQNIEKLIKNKSELENRIFNLTSNLTKKEKELNEHNRLVGSLENKVEHLKEKKKEVEDIENEYAAYDLFMRCMHSNGIAYDIIKKRLPVINEEISKVVSNVVDFEVFFQEDGNKLNILIKHPRHDPRPIEMGSGAEKTIASMGIRLALLSVSSLPRGSVFILDEPATALDSEHLENFSKMLQLIKIYFKTVIVISHLDSLKDIVDAEIIIEKQNGYAKVKI